MSEEVVCTQCGYVGEPKTVTKGSLGVEIIMWLLFLLPGLVYSIWRLSSKHDGCPTCGNTALIPRGAPMAQKFMRENVPDKLLARVEPARPPSKAARGAGLALGRFVGRMFK